MSNEFTVCAVAVVTVGTASTVTAASITAISKVLVRNFLFIIRVFPPPEVQEPRKTLPL